MATTLTRNDWLRAARLALLHRGAGGVQVEPLARDLGVTKGSFYWHFRDRRDVLETLLREWEEETALLSEALRQADPRGEMPAIVAELARRNVASERGDSPSDAAIFAWAATDPAVAARANKAEAERMQLFRRLTGKKELADLFYYAYHGFLLRRRRVQGAAADFDAIARAALRVFGEKKKRTRVPRKPRRAARAATLVAALGFSLSSCTTYRIIRYREPSPDRTVRIFPQRVVKHADTPFRFAVAPRQRTDLDTVTVRNIDFTGKPFAAYARDNRLRAFLVIRHDTIVYERYWGGYTDSTLSSSFSVAKSFTSAVLGVALGRGDIRGLDDSVVRYIPALATRPDFAGITLRHLLQMQSGFAYSRTNGGLWHDFRSSDAKFYHTTNQQRALAAQRRAEPPGQRWAYKDSDADLLAWALAAATKKPLAEQLQDGIWRKIGTEHDASWDLDHASGSENAGSGVNAVARDYARFGRLYLENGVWNGTRVLPADWVRQSTTLDSSRTEPEVAVWWLMQHRNYWWIPMQNWAAEQDFFADGSRGQRIYVNRRLSTIIVQLADQSAQDFPFRRIAHYIAGEPYTYPRVVANQLYAAIVGGASQDSVRALHATLMRRRETEPATQSYSRASMLALAQRLDADKKPAFAALVRGLAK